MLAQTMSVAAEKTIASGAAMANASKKSTAVPELAVAAAHNETNPIFKESQATFERTDRNA
ncbi:MAG: hypothetical protein AAFQ16_10010, partial [Pseudomonadota bacterium]